MNHMDFYLYDAVINDNVDVLKELEGKLSVGNQRTPTDSTVLHLACQYGSIQCVEEILNVYDSLLLKLDSRGETGLHLAAREGHYDVVEALIIKAKSSLLQPDHFQNTSSTVVQILIRLANVEFETALHAAVRYTHNNVVQLLITHDPKHSHPHNMYSETPLYLASIRGDTQIITTILPSADKSVAYLVDKEYKRTALHVATDRGNVRVMKELVKYIPDCLEIVDVGGRNILHIAMKQGQKEMIRFILSQGSRAINKLLIQRDKEGNTPLHFIAKFGCYVRELMDLREVDWEVLNHKNLTPLDLLDTVLDTNYLLTQVRIRTHLITHAKARTHKELWHTLKDPYDEKPDIEKGTADAIKKEKMNQELVEFLLQNSSLPLKNSNRMI
ncbi:hypothetical protein POM88_020732 [Heracleum sosnowskyi]|uniref:Uncharacterized protein n=1 Tax=Heracleum sosnowskyi TaxID=360622 RepID=A0AAD8MS57_9APIA|nr:hypothetical protein POM88_020732 [Heracleum sosnowskyi]